MNVYFIDPTYIKNVAWKPLLDVLKVKSAFSFIKKQDLPQTLLDIINPYTKQFYNGQDVDKYANNCVYWLRKHLEKHTSLPPEDIDLDKITEEEMRKYSQHSPYNNIRNLDDSNVLVLMLLNTYFDGSSPSARIGLSQELTSHISSYCLNIFHKYHQSFIYADRTAFLVFDSFFVKSYLYSNRRREFITYFVHFENQNKVLNFVGFVKKWVNEVDPVNIPMIEKDGKRLLPSLITEEGTKVRQQELEEYEEEKRQEEERASQDDWSEEQAIREWEANERDNEYMRGLLIDGGVWDRDD